jgi:hypothetical protein
MTYLQRLRELENTPRPAPSKHKGSCEFENGTGCEPTKPTKPRFDGFDGSNPAPFPEIAAGVPRLISDVGNGIAWAEWKAAALNRLCQEYGTTGSPSRITVDTVRHGEQAAHS